MIEALRARNEEPHDHLHIKQMRTVLEHWKTEPMQAMTDLLDNIYMLVENLQGEADTAMLGMGVDPAELTPAWGNPTTVAEFAAAVEAPGATRPTE